MVAFDVTPRVSLAKQPWPLIAMGLLFAWLSTSLLLDLVILPICYGAGMMQVSGFPVFGYTLFHVFNRIELLCGALLLTGELVMLMPGRQRLWQCPEVQLASLLLGLALLCTYGLTPQMSSLVREMGGPLTQAETLPQAMGIWHFAYWGVEGVKFLAVGLLLRLNLRSLLAATR